jgi:hypothetical protein
VVVDVVVLVGGVVSEVVVSEVPMVGIGSDPGSVPPHAVRVAKESCDYQYALHGPEVADS